MAGRNWATGRGLPGSMLGFYSAISGTGSTPHSPAFGCLAFPPAGGPGAGALAGPLSRAEGALSEAHLAAKVHLRAVPALRVGHSSRRDLTVRSL